MYSLIYDSICCIDEVPSNKTAKDEHRAAFVVVLFSNPSGAVSISPRFLVQTDETVKPEIFQNNGTTFGGAPLFTLQSGGTKITVTFEKKNHIHFILLSSCAIITLWCKFFLIYKCKFATNGKSCLVVMESFWTFQP